MMDENDRYQVTYFDYFSDQYQYGSVEEGLPLRF